MALKKHLSQTMVFLLDGLFSNCLEKPFDFSGYNLERRKIEIKFLKNDSASILNLGLMPFL